MKVSLFETAFLTLVRLTYLLQFFCRHIPHDSAKCTREYRAEALSDGNPAIFELVEANGRGNDEYYIRNMIDGDYICVNDDISNNSYRTWYSLHFQYDQSKAAVVRLQRYRRDLEPWRRNLKLNDNQYS